MVMLTLWQFLLTGPNPIFINILAMLAYRLSIALRGFRVKEGLGMFRFGTVISTLTWVLLTGILVACGGRGGGSSSPPASSVANQPPSSIAISSLTAQSASTVQSSVSSISSSASSQSSLSATLNISGKVTFDFIPHNIDGLDYAAVIARAGRGLQVELVDENNSVLATTQTDVDGNYSIGVTRNKLVKVRVKAQLLKSQAPGWNFKVTDNTNDNALYSMTGSLLIATDANATRNLHAPSGWTGTGYTQTRVAAPFAILDTIYEGVTRLRSAGNSAAFPALELRWSSKNKPADGELTLGEIGTSFFWGEIKFFVIAGVIRDMHLAIFTRNASIFLKNNSGIVMQSNTALFKKRGNNNDTQLFCEFTQGERAWSGDGFSQIKVSSDFLLAKIQATMEFL